MKKILITIIALHFTSFLFSQEDEKIAKKKIEDKNRIKKDEDETVDIDPRQFVEIREFYRNNRDKNKEHDLYFKDSLNQRIIYKNRKAKTTIIDINSLITVDLNKEKMAGLLDFYGNVSLVASIDDVPIKISPYSAVGEKQDDVGIKSASANEISTHVISLLEKTNKLSQKLEPFTLENENSENTKYLPNEGKYYSFKKTIQRLTKYFNDVYTDKNQSLEYQELNETVKKDIENSNISGEFLYFLKGITSLKVQDIISRLNEIKSEIKEDEKKINDEDKVYKKEIILQKIEQYKILPQYIDLEIEYLNYFQNKEDDDLQNLFLRLTQIDVTLLNNLTIKLKQSSSLIKTLSINMNNPESTMEAIDLYLNFIKLELFSFQERITTALENFTNTRISFTELPEFKQRDSDDQTKVNEQEVNKRLAKEIGTLVYQKLVTAKVDLRESRAKPSQILTIKLLWYRNSKAEENKPMTMELASYKINQTGWSTNVFDSFLLIERYSIPSNSNNEGSNYTPSNFKGAPGVSLVRTLRNDDSGNFFKKIEPSFGINVSYIDFYQNKDLEIGVGGVLGLFNNKILFTLGYNLNSESNGGYIGVGFSFVNIAGQLKK